MLFDLPALFNDYASLRQYMENSTLYLSVVPCCPSGGSTARVQAELVLLQGGGNCPACQVALSRVSHDIIIQCPGCVTPGVIVDDVRASRLNFGLVDADNDGLPDQPLATLQPGPGSTAASLSMQGDTIRVTVQAFGQEGDDTDGGFTYGQWAQLHGDSLRWLNLDLVNPCAWQDTFDWVGIADSLRVRQDSGWGNWFSVAPWRYRHGSQYQYRLPGDLLHAQGLLDRPHFKPGDQYEFRLDYRVCGNFHSDAKHQLACGITAVCWWSGVQQGPDARDHAEQVGVHWSSLPDTLPLPTRVAACGLDLLYYCETYGTNHFNLGWRQHVTARWRDIERDNWTSCDKRYQFRVRRHLGVLDDENIRNWLPGNSAQPSRYFPGEYRPLRHEPGLLEWSSPQGYALSLAESGLGSNSRYLNANGSLVTLGCTLSQLPGVYSALGGQENLDLAQGAPLAFVPLEDAPCAGTALYSSDEFLEYTFTLVYKPDTCLATDYTVLNHGELAFTGAACTGAEQLAGGSLLDPTLRYPRPDLQVLNQQASLVLGSNPTATGFQVRNAPTPPNTPGGRGPAENVFVQLQPPAGISVSNLQWTATGNNLPFQAVTGQHLLFTHPRLDRGASWVHACSFELSLDSCTATPDSIMVRFGWQCHGPLLDAGLAACWEDTAWIHVVPALPTLLPGDMASGPLVACDTVRVSSCTYSTNTGLVNQFSFELHLPPGATLMPGSVTASIDDIPPLVTGPLQAVSNQGDSVYTFVLDPAWGLAGTPSSPLCVNFVFDYMPGCNPGPAALPWLLVRGISFCGDTLGVVLQRLDSLPLAGDNCVPLDVQLQSITAAGCNGGGAIDITASGEPPLQYSWTGPNGFTASTANIYNLQAGLYQLVLTDLRGCSLTAQYTVPLDSLPNLWLEANASCVGQQLLLGVQGDQLPGYTYSWAGPNGPIVAGGPDYSVAQASLQDAGQYSVTVSAPGGGCTVLQAQVQVWMNCCGLQADWVVGSNVGIDNIGMALSSGAIPQAIQGWTNAPVLLVDGTFHFDVAISGSINAYHFPSGSEILMAPGSEVVIHAGNHVVLQSTVTPCDSMWRSFHVLTEGGITLKGAHLDGAEHGVLLEKGATINCHGTTFTRCYTGIHSELVGPGNLVYSPVESSTFSAYGQGPTTMPPPYAGMPAGHDSPLAGIYTRNVLGFEVGGWGNSPCRFENLPHGILAAGYSYYILTSSRFDDMGKSGVYAVGTGGTSQLAVDGVNISGQAGTVEFHNSRPNATYEAIVAEMSSLKVMEALFRDVAAGIRATVLPGCNVNIGNNDMVARSRGISLTGMHPQGLAQFSEVQGNNITVTGSKAAGISLHDCLSPLWVRQNSVHVDRARQQGIWLNGCNNAALFLSSNDVHMGLPGGLQSTGHNNLPEYGINVDHSPNVSVDCNHVLGTAGFPRATGFTHQDSSTWPGLNRYIGYRQVMSPGVDVNCNAFDNLRVCSRFEWGNLGSRVRGNVFDQDNQVGLWVSSGLLGNIANAGNMWYGTFDQGYGAWNAAPQLPNRITIDQSHVSIPFLNPSWSMYPAGVPYLPFVGPLPFTNPTYFCMTDNTICAMYPPLARLSGAFDVLDTLVAQGGMPYGDYGAELNAWDDKVLYEKLKGLDSLSSLMSLFKDSLELYTAYDEFYQLGAERLALWAVEDSLRAVALGLQASLGIFPDSLRYYMEAIQLAAGQMDSSFYAGQLAQYREAMMASSKDYRVKTLGKGEVVENLAGTYSVQVNATPVNDYQDWVLKTALAVYYESLAKGVMPDTNQLAVLEGIVYQCPVVAGPGIYLARSIYASRVDELYTDEDVCMGQGLQLREEHAPLEKGYQVYPIPSSNWLTVSSPELVKSYRVLDNTGRVIVPSQVLKEAATWIELDMGWLENGLYILELHLESGALKSLKFIIAK